MKRTLALAALAISVSAAPADPKLDAFAARFPVTVPSGAAHVRVVLTEAVIRHSRSPDLADLRVFNAAGEALPLTLRSPAAEAAKESAVTLPIYPIEARVQQLSADGRRLEVISRGGTTRVIVEGQGAVAHSPDRVAAYLVDAREVREHAVGLELDASFDRARLIPVTVEASRDLKAWRTLASAEPVYRLGEGDAQQTRTTVRLPRPEVVEGHFLRFTWQVSAQFDLRGVRLLVVPATRPPPPPEIVVGLGEPVAGDGRELEWSVPAPVRFARLDVRLPEANVLVPVNVLARRRLGEPWVAVGRGVVYRIEQGGAESASPALGFQPGSYQGIKLVAAAGGSFGAGKPTAALRLPAQELIFLARDGPYVIATGNTDAPPVALPIATLVPGYKTDAEKAFPQGTIGAAELDSRLTTPVPLQLFGLDSRTIALWAVLVGAVALLAVFAWVLLRGLQRGQGKVTPPA